MKMYTQMLVLIAGRSHMCNLSYSDQVGRQIFMQFQVATLCVYIQSDSETSIWNDSR